MDASTNILYQRTGTNPFPPENTPVAACWGKPLHNSQTVLEEEIQEEGHASWSGSSWYQKLEGNVALNWKPCAEPLGWANHETHEPHKTNKPRPTTPEEISDHGEHQTVVRIVEFLKFLSQKNPHSQNWSWGDVELEIERIFQEDGITPTSKNPSLDQQIEAVWAASKGDPTLTTAAETLEKIRGISQIQDLLQR